jgi:uncharacterized protein (TIGR03086 family)
MTGASMTSSRAAEEVPLTQAIRYALGTVGTITPEQLPNPTPCQGWDLRMLLSHAAESLAVLREGISIGHVSLVPGCNPGAHPVHAFRDQARLLLEALPSPALRRQEITIGGFPLRAAALTAIGALEIAVHGWDISQASATCQPIPPLLATGLLATALLLVPANNRHPLFAAPVSTTTKAHPSDQLVAFLGRTPLARPGAR